MGQRSSDRTQTTSERNTKMAGNAIEVGRGVPITRIIARFPHGLQHNSLCHIQSKAGVVRGAVGLKKRIQLGKDERRDILRANMEGGNQMTNNGNKLLMQSFSNRAFIKEMVNRLSCAGTEWAGRVSERGCRARGLEDRMSQSISRKKKFHLLAFFF